MMKKHKAAPAKAGARRANRSRGAAALRIVARAIMLLSLGVSIVGSILGYMVLRQPVLQLPDEDAGVVAIPLQNDPLDLPETLPDEPLVAEQPATSGSETSIPQFMMTEQEPSCVEPGTAEISVRAGPKVYRWTDANGRTVFGDRPPADAVASVLEVETQSRLDYFDMEIINRGVGSVAFIQDRLQANMTATYETLAGLVGQERLRKVDMQIVVFPDRDTYLDYALSITGSDMSQTNGFYTSSTNEAVTYLQSTEEATLEVARHEATHVIIRGLLGDPPPWLNEGLAEYFSMLTVSGTFHQVGVQPERLAVAIDAIASGYPATLSSFLTMRRQQWNNEDVSRHYAIAWGLVFFLMNSEQGRISFANLLDSYADSYCTRLSSRSLLDENWPGGLVALQQEFYSWMLEVGTKRSHVF